MQIIWETWFKSSWTHFLFCCRTCQSLYHEGGHYNYPRKESISKLTFGAHLSIVPRIVNLGLLAKMLEIPGGVLRQRMDHYDSREGGCREEKQELDLEDLLGSRPSQPGRVCEGHGGGGGLACIWPTGIKERLLLTVGSMGKKLNSHTWHYPNKAMLLLYRTMSWLFRGI